jgi:hypothetical protein
MVAAQVGHRGMLLLWQESGTQRFDNGPPGASGAGWTFHSRQCGSGLQNVQQSEEILAPHGMGRVPQRAGRFIVLQGWSRMIRTNRKTYMKDCKECELAIYCYSESSTWIFRTKEEMREKQAAIDDCPHHKDPSHYGLNGIKNN